MDIIDFILKLDQYVAGWHEIHHTDECEMNRKRYANIARAGEIVRDEVASKAFVKLCYSRAAETEESNDE